MTKEEIRNEIDRLERAIFYEEMADFLDWGKYYELKNKVAKLKAQLEAEA